MGEAGAGAGGHLVGEAVGVDGREEGVVEAVEVVGGAWVEEVAMTAVALDVVAGAVVSVGEEKGAEEGAMEGVRIEGGGAGGGVEDGGEEEAGGSDFACKIGLHVFLRSARDYLCNSNPPGLPSSLSLNHDRLDCHHCHH